MKSKKSRFFNYAVLAAFYAITMRAAYEWLGTPDPAPGDAADAALAAGGCGFGDDAGAPFAPSAKRGAWRNCFAQTTPVADDNVESQYEPAAPAAPHDADAKKQEAAARQRAVARSLIAQMRDVHLSHPRFDQSMSAFSWTNYLESLDYGKLYFTQSDIAEFEPFKYQISSLAAAGDLSFAKNAFERFHQRVRERVAFLEANAPTNAAAIDGMPAGLEFPADATFRWRRKDAGWTADAAEQDELWRKIIANAIISARVAGTIQNEKNLAAASATNNLAAAEADATNTVAIAELSAKMDGLAADMDDLAAAVAAMRDTDATNAADAAETNNIWQFIGDLNDDDSSEEPPFLITSGTKIDRTKLIPFIPDAETNAAIEVAAATTADTADTARQPQADEDASNPSAPSTPSAPIPQIKSEAEMIADAAENLLKSHKQHLGILDDSDSDFYASKFLNAITAAYDPHSSYMSPETAEDFGIDMQLSLQGIGATLRTEDGAAKIEEIIPGSPAERDTSENRLVRGDKIIGVAQGEDGEFVDIRHWPLNKAVRVIRGPKGSTVRLKVIPVADINSEKIVTLVRDEIKLEEQAAASRLETISTPSGENGAEKERKLGYIRLPSFYASMRLGANPDATPRSASADVARLVSELNSENIEGLILDLRGNGGGSLPEAVYLAGLFIRTGPVVQVKEARRTIPLPDNDPSVAFDKPLIVMIDRLSASASEIVAGALQDYGRALVVGDTHSHGKGTVQSLLPLQNGRLGSLKATTSAFYRITGGSTQIRGVASDIVLPSIFQHYKELGEDNLPNALPWNRISPASFRRVDNLLPIVPALKERSDARLAGNEKWRKYSASLSRVASNATNDYASLDFAARLAKARDDEAFSKEHTFATDDELDLQRNEDLPPELDTPAAAPGRFDKKERDELRRKNDIVLDETLNILADLIDLHGSPPTLEGEHAPISEFFQSFYPF